MANDSFLNEAKTLLASKQPIKAMQLLETRMDENAGLPSYDYLLGKSAIAAKKPNLAIFALERVALTKPRLYKARFLLARAYYNTGELEQASREFNYVIHKSNKNKLRAASQQYLRSIEDYRKSKNQPFNLALTLGVGSDSNVNNATDSETFKNLTLSPLSREKSSNVVKTIISSGYQHRLPLRLRFNSSTQLFDFNYRDAEFVNTRGAAINFGVDHRSKNRSRQSVSVGYQHIIVNGVFNSRQLKSSLTHYQKISQQFSLRAKFSGYQTDFNNLYDIKNARGINGGMQVYHLSGKKSEITSSMSLITGVDKPIKETSPYGYKYANALVSVSFRNGRKSSITSNISYTQKQFDKKFFSVTRNEKSLALSTQINLRPVKKWTFSSQFRILRTRSPISLYQYDKVQLMFFITRKLV